MTHHQLDQLCNDYWAFRCAEFPIEAIKAGCATETDVLLRDAPADHERRAEWADAALARLRAIGQGDLSTRDRAIWSLLEHDFRELVSLVACRGHLRPSIYPLGPDFRLTYWASSSAPATFAEAQSYIERLRAIPAALRGVCEALAEGADQDLRYPRLVVMGAIDQARRQASMPVDASPFHQQLARMAGRSSAWAAVAEEGRLAVEQTVYPAFRDYADFLEARLLPKSRDGLACTDDIDGVELYRHHIRSFTTVEMDAEEIHALGLAEVERITGEMLSVAAEAGFKGQLAEFRRRLQTDNEQFATSGDALREQMEILSKRIDARIPEYFGRIPRITYGVKSIPEEVAAKMPPAYAQPNPADGSTAGIHWITSLPGNCPRYMHLPIAMHEAWPGHLMHHALIQEMDHLPDFQRYSASRYTACLEGWALYCEGLGNDMGFYDTPEKRYGRLEMEMWRAVRLVVDTGLHARGWSREQAIAYFQQHMAMPLATVMGEVDRYIGYPGQALSYQIGNLKFREIRAHAEDALGSAFEIRGFHDAVMAAGPVTLPVLQTLVAEWVAGQREEKAA